MNDEVVKLGGEAYLRFEPPSKKEFVSWDAPTFIFDSHWMSFIVTSQAVVLELQGLPGTLNIKVCFPRETIWGSFKWTFSGSIM